MWIAKELERLDQEIRVIQHVLDEARPGKNEELVQLLRHVASRASRIADQVEKEQEQQA